MLDRKRFVFGPEVADWLHARYQYHATVIHHVRGSNTGAKPLQASGNDCRGTSRDDAFAAAYSEPFNAQQVSEIR